jgi:hypothetical protein
MATPDLFARARAASSKFAPPRTSPAPQAPDPGEVLHTHGGQSLTRADLCDIVGKGHHASRVAGGKLPMVTGRNAALMAGAGLVDVGRHMYLGQRDEAAQRQQLRELMGQVARETANRG